MDNSPNSQKNNTNLFLEEEIDFLELFKSISRRWKWLAGGSIAGIAVSLFNINTTKPLYEGQFKIVLEDNNKNQSISSLISENPGLAAVANSSGLTSKNSMETEIEVLYSSSVLKPVYEALKKEKNSDKFNNVLFKNWVKKAINVEPKRKTTVLTVKFRDTQKSLIYPITKLISETYQKYSNEGTQTEIDNLINYLEKQIINLKPIAKESAIKATEFGYKNNLTAQDGLPISAGSPFQNDQFNNLAALVKGSSLSSISASTGVNSSIFNANICLRKSSSKGSSN